MNLDVLVTLARAQGIFNLLNGLWPLVHYRSFERVLGPKVDDWLVRSVAVLLVANGITQVSADPSSPEAVTAARRLGLGTALGMMSIDLVYVPKGRISKMYLLDAVMETGWIAAWVAASVMEKSRRHI